MPAQVVDFINDSREITVTHNNRKLRVVYRPSRFNSGYIERMEEMRAEENSNHKIGVFSICTLIKSWDMVGPLVVEAPVLDDSGDPVVDRFGVGQFETKTIVRDGEPVPVTSDVVQYFSQDFMSALIAKINEDMSPKAKRSNGSSNSRSRTRTNTTDDSN